MTTEPASVDLFEWLGERMIRNIEEQPITVTVHLSGGSIEMPIGPKHPWYKELNRRRTEQVSHVVPAPGRQIVEADDRVTPGDEVLAQVRAQEARPSRHHDAAHRRPIPV